MTVRIQTHVDSEMVRLPELRPFIGKDVEILVRETPRTTAELPLELNNVKPFSFETMKGGWPDAANDGFEDTVESWRKNDELPELPE